MNSTQTEPLNLRLVRITPRWVRSRAWRRRLAVAYYLAPTLWLVLGAVWPSSLLWLAPFGLGIPLLSLLWLMGATGARADLPDTLLDEREQQLRGEVYQSAFIFLMGMVALVYLVLTLLEAVGVNLPLEPRNLIGLLFFAGFPLPTLVQAWREPEPLEEEFES
jgi:hypothetical protein